jgi:signal transduction histidine kinase
VNIVKDEKRREAAVLAQNGVNSVNVLLVDDDEDDYLILRDLLAEIPEVKFALGWCRTGAGIWEALERTGYDICLIDYKLGDSDGLELLRELRRRKFTKPIIMLTAQGDRDVDLQAMEEGATDYLEKGNLRTPLLERSIRYALRRERTLAELRRTEERLRVLSAKLVDAQEKEREIVAKDIHDSIGSNLAAVKYGLEEKLCRMDHSENSAEGITLEQLLSVVRATIEETQRVCTDLRPAMLDDIGILATIQSTSQKFQEVYSGIRIEEQLDLQEEDVPERLKIVIYRILQEALNNISKHSGADRVRVCLVKKEDRLEFEIEDNGRGFDVAGSLSQDHHGSGMGLATMRERAELSGGISRIFSEEGEGARIWACWPA